MLHLYNIERNKQQFLTKNLHIMTTYIRDRKTNKITFYQNGAKVYPISISGNIAEFENGDIVLF